MGIYDLHTLTPDFFNRAFFPSYECSSNATNHMLQVNYGNAANLPYKRAFIFQEREALKVRELDTDVRSNADERMI